MHDIGASRRAPPMKSTAAQHDIILHRRSGINPRAFKNQGQTTI
jgi:hypothetical protein